MFFFSKHESMYEMKCDIETTLTNQLLVLVTNTHSSTNQHPHLLTKCRNIHAPLGYHTQGHAF